MKTLHVILKVWIFCDLEITNSYICDFKITNYCIWRNTIIIVFHTFLFSVKICSIFKLEKVRVYGWGWNLYLSRYKSACIDDHTKSWIWIRTSIQNENTSAGHFLNLHFYMVPKKLQKFEGLEMKTFYVILRFLNFCDFKITNSLLCVFENTNYCIWRNTIIIVFDTFLFSLKICSIFKLENVRV